MAQSTVRASQKQNARIPQIARLSLSYIALFLLTAVFVIPLLWMLLTAFKTNAEATQSVPTWIPRDFSTVGFQTILNTTSQTPVLWWLFNSAFAAIAHVVLVLVTAAPAAYALARLDFRGRNVMFAVIISTLFIPPIIFLMPSYLIVDYLRWIDTLLAVIVPTAAGAFGVFFLRQFFVSLPIELEERSEEHTSELQSRQYLVCRLLLEKKKNNNSYRISTSKTINQQSHALYISEQLPFVYDDTKTMVGQIDQPIDNGLNNYLYHCLSVL